MVQCIKLKQEALGLERPPFPGEKGKWVYNHISQKAWKLWQQHQTRLINEKRLSLIAPDTRAYLTEQMEKFFKDEDYDRAEGYVPEEK